MRNPFKAFSFQITFFFSFLIFSLVLIVLLGTTSYTITNQETVKQTIESRKLLLKEINIQLNAKLKEVESDSLVLSSNPQIINFLENEGNTYESAILKREVIAQISRLSYIKEGVHSVQLFSRKIDSMEWMGNNGVFSSSLVEKSSWYDRINRSDYSWIGEHDVEMKKNDMNEEVVSFARKVIGSGKEVGILVINMKLTHINKIIENTSPNDSRYILDYNNRLITEIIGNGMDSFAYKNYKDQIIDAFDHPDHEQFNVSNTNKKVLLIWSKQIDTNWVIVDIISRDDLTKGGQRINKVVIAAALLCTILAICMAFVLSRQFVDPILKLIKAMNQVKIGKTNNKMENEYTNEFGHLNNQFSHMIQRIEDLLQEVSDRNRDKLEAELQMLQEQINPHFIYNTLDMINWQAIENGDDSVSKMLTLLGKMLRIGLSKGATFIPLKSEMDHLHCYIELQKIRYQNRIQFSVSIPETIAHYLVPKLILQPFIENSLIHGIKYDKQGMIEISACETSSGILFMITDNGSGMDFAQFNINEKIKGSGISNVQARIKLYFGDNYGVHYESKLDQGTTIRILIPRVSPEQPNLMEEA